MQCPGAEMENVKILETHKDAAAIYQMSLGKKAVIVGTSFIGMATFLYKRTSSFVLFKKALFTSAHFHSLKLFLTLFNPGMEVAAYLSDKAASVAVVGKSKFPYQFSLGPDIGKMTMKVRVFLRFLECFAMKQ